MATALRKTGIDPVGDMPWGTHFCHFYDLKDDLVETLVPYFRAGLNSKEFCLWVVSDLTKQEAMNAMREAVPDLERHLADGSMEFILDRDWYIDGGMPALGRVLRGWNEKLTLALNRGYAGMRATGNTLWLEKKDWNDFNAYEQELNGSIANRPMTCLCSYPVAASGAAEVLDVVHTHQFTVARRKGIWQVLETPELGEAK